MERHEPDWFDRFLDTLDRSISGEDFATAVVVLVVTIAMFFVY